MSPHLCPGRLWAFNEIKIAICLVMKCMDPQLITEEVPTLDFSRVGLGIYPPSKNTIEISYSFH